jgi:hypothetical protein
LDLENAGLVLVLVLLILPLSVAYMQQLVVAKSFVHFYSAQVANGLQRHDHVKENDIA